MFTVMTVSSDRGAAQGMEHGRAAGIVRALLSVPICLFVIRLIDA